MAIAVLVGWGGARRLSLRLGLTIVAASGLLAASPVAARATVTDPWVQQAELTASNGSAGNQFGGTMATSSDGSTLVVGAAGAGKAYVFTWSGSSWSQTAELTASGLAAYAAVGLPVAVSSNGSTIVVGSPFQTVGGNAQQGAAFVFTKSASTWKQTAELTASDGASTDDLGTGLAVSANGQTIVAGAPNHANGQGSQNGVVYVFTESGSKWSQAAELSIVNDPAENYQESLGWSVAVSADGSTVVAGAPTLTSFYGVYIGGAFVFDKPGASWASTASPTATLSEPDQNVGGVVGRSVAISGKTTIAAGASGSGEVYVFTGSGSTWSQSAVLTDSGNDLGASTGNNTVAISGNGTTIVAGAPTHQIADNTSQGAAYVFSKSGSSWTQAAQLTNAADGAQNDQLGESVGLSGQAVLAGAPEHAVGGNLQQGAVYVFGSGALPPESLSVSGPASAEGGVPVSASAMAARLLGASSPTGTITFTVFGPQSAPPTSCSSGGTAVGTATVTGDDGTYHPTSTWTPGAAGEYWWYASYGGDASNGATASTCGASMPETTVFYPAEVGVAAPSNDKLGTAIPASAIKAYLSYGDSPTGTMTFTVFGPQSSPPTSCTSGGTTVGTAPVSGDGSYSPSAGFTPTTAGYYWWYASYGGDSNNDPAGSICDSQYMAEMVVPSANAASPSLSMTAPSTGTVGTQIAASSLSAVLSGGSSPTGTITFAVYGPQTSPPASCSSGGPTASVSGNGTYHPGFGFSPSQAGDYWWYATYNADINNNPAQSACGASMAKTVVSAGGPPPTLKALKPAVGPDGAERRSRLPGRTS